MVLGKPFQNDTLVKPCSSDVEKRLKFDKQKESQFQDPIFKSLGV